MFIQFSQGEVAEESVIRISQYPTLIADETRLGAQMLKNELERSRHRINVVASTTLQSEIFRSLDAYPVDIALINENLEEGSYLGSRFCRSCENATGGHALSYCLNRPPVISSSMRSGEESRVFSVARIRRKRSASAFVSCTTGRYG